METNKKPNLNQKLFFTLYGLATKNKAVKYIAIALSKCAEIIFFTIYGIGALVVMLSGRKMLLLKYLAVPLATLLYNTFLRKILARPRPFVREDGVENMTNHKASGSCPSNHAASAMVIALAWYCIYPPAVYLLVVLAVLTGLSRIITAAHYPLDVIIGWMIGLIAGILGFVIKYF